MRNSLGWILWRLNLAYLLQRVTLNVFRAMTFLGAWSYYIYLVHQPFARGARAVVLLLVDADAGILIDVLANMLGLLFAAICTAIASFLLRKFDRSALADLMFARIRKLIPTENI